MPFQSTVRINQTSGIVGDIVLEGPMRGSPGILNSTSPLNNVIGRAFRHLTDKDMEISADAAKDSVFAGILANSKDYATSGTSAGGTLAPTLTLPNNSEVEVVAMTSGILVDLSTSAKIGDHVFFATATGILAAATGTVLADHELITNAKIVRHNISAAGPAIVQLTE